VLHNTFAGIDTLLPDLLHALHRILSLGMASGVLGAGCHLFRPCRVSRLRLSAKPPIVALVLRMDVRAVLNCQIGSWYAAFEHVTYRTRLIELPNTFVEYLLADGVYLPERSAAVSRL